MLKLWLYLTALATVASWLCSVLGMKINIIRPGPYGGDNAYPVNLTFEVGDPAEFYLLKFRMDYGFWSDDATQVKDFTQDKSVDILYALSQRIVLAAFLEPHSENATMAGALATSDTFKVKDPPYATKSSSGFSESTLTLTRTVTTTITASGLQHTNITLLADADLINYEKRVVFGLSIALGVTALIIILLSGYALLLRHRLSKTPMANPETPSHHQRSRTGIRAVGPHVDGKTSPSNKGIFAQGWHTRRSGVSEDVTPFMLQLPVEMQREKEVVAL